MQNAHLRFGRLEYARQSGKIQTTIRVHVDRYMGEDTQAHLLSVFGGDAEIGAISAATAEGHTFSLTFPDGKTQYIGLGQNASCYRGSLSIAGRKQPLRHLIAVSEALHANGTAGKTYILNYNRSVTWATFVSLLGVPADPRWGEWALAQLERDKKITDVEGIGCEPVVVQVTRDGLMECIARGISKGTLPFPEVNGPVLWPQYGLAEALASSSVKNDTCNSMH
jgi:hypothetical protein